MKHVAWLALLLFVAGEAGAQTTLSTASANVGVIRHLVQDAPEARYLLYPEIQIGGGLLVSPLRWTVFGGYWTDGVKEPRPWADYVTYSYSSFLLGARLTFLPSNLLPHWPLPVGLFTGVAHHFISVEYIGGSGYSGERGKDYTDNSTTLEFGINLEVKLVGSIAVRAEARQFVPLGTGWLDRSQVGRRAYTAGLAWSF